MGYWPAWASATQRWQQGDLSVQHWSPLPSFSEKCSIWCWEGCWTALSFLVLFFLFLFFCSECVQIWMVEWAWEGVQRWAPGFLVILVPEVSTQDPHLKGWIEGWMHWTDSQGVDQKKGIPTLGARRQKSKDFKWAVEWVVAHNESAWSLPNASWDFFSKNGTGQGFPNTL